MSLKDSMNFVAERAKAVRSAGRRGALYGGLGGAALGSLSGLKKTDHSGHEFTKKQRIMNAVLGGLSIGATGAMFGHDIGRIQRSTAWGTNRHKGWMDEFAHRRAGGTATPPPADGFKSWKDTARAHGVHDANVDYDNATRWAEDAARDWEERFKARYRAYTGGAEGFGGGGYSARSGAGAGGGGYRARSYEPPPPPATPDWLKGVTTKAEGRRAYHAQARKHHPDLGGDPEILKKVNAEWAQHEPLFKKAMYAAFAEEIEKIASLGALAGGYAGHRLAGKGLKGQAIGIAGGALLGHLTGKGLGVAKRELVDKPEHREAAELYGYVPPPPSGW